MYKKVLFATDFDDVGIHAAHKAKKIAEENGAHLFLVHVVEPIPAYAYPGFAGFAEVEVSIREQAEKELDSLADLLGVDAKHRFLEFGSTKNEVLRVKVKRKGKPVLAGVANIGTRPTIDGSKNVLEVHLFDFDESLYDEMLQVFFLHKLRDEIKFSSVDALIEQIHLDVAAARNIYDLIE